MSLRKTMAVELGFGRTEDMDVEIKVSRVSVSKAGTMIQVDVLTTDGEFVKREQYNVEPLSFGDGAGDALAQSYAILKDESRFPQFAGAEDA